MMMGNPEKLKWSNSINPVRMSQMLSNIIPRFFGSLISFSFASVRQAPLLPVD